MEKKKNDARIFFLSILYIAPWFNQYNNNNNVYECIYSIQ